MSFIRELLAGSGGRDEEADVRERKNMQNREREKKSGGLWKKVLLGAAGVLLAAVLVAGIAVYAVWHNEISAVASMELLRDRNDEHLDGAVYKMEVKGGFYLDDFVAQGGVKNDTELISFVTDKITKGLIDMNISDPEIGCSSLFCQVIFLKKSRNFKLYISDE